MMEKVRLGIIGVGNMGTIHARNMKNIGNVTLAAVCDLVESRAGSLAAELRCKAFTDSSQLIHSGEIDAALIATPHYFHTTIGIEALEAGLHVLVEKPISVHKADCERLIAAHMDRKKVFAAMFNQRTDPHYFKVKELIDSGELGPITRVNWIITNWFRTESYYASGGWRATWKGEGGGVLLNQCPHNLDLLQWICGMPSRVTAKCSLGKWHKIEVEDEVTATLEYPNGATGIFITTTGEAPGTNRFEICGDRGKIVIENNRIQYTRNETGAKEFCTISKEPFASPGVWNIDIPANGNGGQHNEIIRNFIDGILNGVPLIAPAEEGIRSVELANAMLYSSFTDRSIDLPIDASAYESMLKELIAESRFEKKVVENTGAEMSKSFMH